MAGLRHANGGTASPPYKNGPYTWDQAVTLTNTLTIQGSTGIAFTSNIATVGIKLTNGITVPIFMECLDIDWDGADEFIDLRTINSDTTPTDSVPMVRLRTETTVTTTSGTNSCLAVVSQCEGTGTATLMGIDSQIDFKDSSTIKAGHNNAVYAAVEVRNSVTTTGECRAGYFYIRSTSATTGGFEVLRLECNSSTVTWDDHFINLVGNPNYTFAMSAAGTANSASGTPSVQAGWMKINAGGSDRWIRLYSTSP